MAITTRLAELLSMCGEPEPDPFSSQRWRLDENTMNFILYIEDKDLNSVMTPWDWWVIPELCRLCEMQGLPVPVDPPLDIRTIW